MIQIVMPTFSLIGYEDGEKRYILHQKIQKLVIVFIQAFLFKLEMLYHWTVFL
jgi:hypothetical protein